MRIALAQLTTGLDPAASAALIADLVSEAAAGGAAMLFTPEMSNLLDRDRARAARAIRAEADDPVLAAARRAARDHGIWVHLGSLALSGGEGGRNLNRTFVIDDRGQIAARYDKLHLFDVDLPDGTSWRESAAYQAGASAAVVDTPVGRIGLSICYDLRFAALFAALSGAGATVLTVPAAFTGPTGRAHWHVLLRARAIENACFVVAAAQTGTHADGRETFGHSLVVDPWGRVLLDMGEAAGLAFCDLDLAEIAKVRARVPVLAHRKPIPRVHEPVGDDDTAHHRSS